MESGRPPILTGQRWLPVHHGVKVYGRQLVHRGDVALLDRDRPHMVIGPSRSWVFQAEARY